MDDKPVRTRFVYTARVRDSAGNVIPLPGIVVPEKRRIEIALDSLEHLTKTLPLREAVILPAAHLMMHFVQHCRPDLVATLMLQLSATRCVILFTIPPPSSSPELD